VESLIEFIFLKLWSSVLSLALKVKSWLWPSYFKSLIVVLALEVKCLVVPLILKIKSLLVALVLKVKSLVVAFSLKVKYFVVALVF